MATSASGTIPHNSSGDYTQAAQTRCLSNDMERIHTKDNKPKGLDRRKRVRAAGGHERCRKIAFASCNDVAFD